MCKEIKISLQFLRFCQIVYGHAGVDEVAVLDLDPLKADGGRHGPVEGVALLGLWPHTEHRAPGVCHRVKLHHLGEADKLVLVEGPRVRHFVGVIHGQRAATAVVNIPSVTRCCAF